MPDQTAPTPTADQLDCWVVAAQDGDREACEQLVLSTQPAVRRFVADRVHTYDLVEEIVQSTYVSVIDKLHTYRPRGTFLSWVRAIARNRAMDELRRRRRLLQADPDSLEHFLFDEYQRDNWTDNDNDSYQQHGTSADDLQHCLERLRPQAQRLIAARYQEELPVKVLAQRFRKPAGAISAQLTRIRSALRRCLETRS